MRAQIAALRSRLELGPYENEGDILATNMIAGFALELSLKLFYMTFNESAPRRTHELNELWQELPPRWKEAVGQAYKEDIRSTQKIVLIAMQRAPTAPEVPAKHTVQGVGTADGLFAEMSKAFHQARYFYEDVENGEWAHITSAPQQMLAMIDVLTSFYDHLLSLPRE